MLSFIPLYRGTLEAQRDCHILKTTLLVGGRVEFQIIHSNFRNHVKKPSPKTPTLSLLPAAQAWSVIYFRVHSLCGLCNKLPQTQWLNTTSYQSCSLEARSLKRVHGLCSFPEALEGAAASFFSVSSRSPPFHLSWSPSPSSKHRSTFSLQFYFTLPLSEHRLLSTSLTPLPPSSQDPCNE